MISRFTPHQISPTSQSGCSPKNYSSYHPCCKMISVHGIQVRPPTSSDDLLPFPFCIYPSSMASMLSPVLPATLFWTPSCTFPAIFCLSFFLLFPAIFGPSSFFIISFYLVLANLFALVFLAILLP